MDLSLATLDDIDQELRRRNCHFTLIVSHEDVDIQELGPEAIEAQDNRRLAHVRYGNGGSGGMRFSIPEGQKAVAELVKESLLPQKWKGV
jgi:hypothetical protein